MSYLIGVPVLVAGLSLVKTWGVLENYVPRILVVYGPGLAALILAHLSRRDGAAGLLRVLLPSRVDLAWVIGILVASAVTFTLALCVAGVNAAQMLASLRADGYILLAHFILQVFVVAVGEELGWRGWLLPRLLERLSWLQSTLATACVWTLWHGPLLITDLKTSSMFVLGVLGLSVLFTWIWASTRRRLFAVVIAHAAANAPMFFWNQVSAGAGGTRLATAWYSLQAMYAAAGLALLILKWRWWTTTDVQVASAFPSTV